jgi:hypothetical protein
MQHPKAYGQDFAGRGGFLIESGLQRFFNLVV